MGLFDAIGNIFGGSPNGSGFQAQYANLVQPTTAAQALQGYGQAQGGLDQQQALINALQAQGGIQNQSNVYNQLAGVAAGQGPNPAQAMLNQATGANVANQAALMASQRGVGANAGLMARQAGLVGAGAQQQAAGQGATLQANQALNAMGQMGNIAGQQVQNQMGAVGGYNQYAQNEQQQLLNAIAQQNASNVAMQSNVNNANAGMAGVNAGITAEAIGGIASGLGGLGASSGLFGTGAQTAQQAGNLLAKGGRVENPKLAAVSVEDRFPSHVIIPPHLQNLAMLYHGNQFAYGGMPLVSGGLVPGQAPVQGDSPTNDVVDAKLSPGEVVIPRSVMESDDPVGNAAAFVAQLQKKDGKKGGDKKDFKDALQRAISGRKNK